MDNRRGKKQGPREGGGKRATATPDDSAKESASATAAEPEGRPSARRGGRDTGDVELRELGGGVGDVTGGGRSNTPSGQRPPRFAREGDEGRLAEGSAADASGGFGFTFEEQNVTPDLDPQLQHVLLAAQAGRIDPALVQEADDGTLRVDVLAVLRDPSQPVPGLEVGQSVGDIVTGSCVVEDIEAVRSHPNVVSLKGATKVESNVRFSVPEIRGSQKALREALPSGAGTPDGTGVIVGVVDFGCDYAHENFREPGRDDPPALSLGSERREEFDVAAGYPFGREFTARHIDDALRSGSPYTFLSYDPFEDSHGTHVMDTAAGNGRGTGSPGVAPKADLIFVELAGGDYRPDESFGNSRRLMEAVKYIFDKAAQLGRPAVVNLSLGTHGGRTTARPRSRGGSTSC